MFIILRARTLLDTAVELVERIVASDWESQSRGGNL